MTMVRLLAATAAAAFAFVAVPAQAEMKKEWVEYSHGSTKLKAYMASEVKSWGEVVRKVGLKID